MLAENIGLADRRQLNQILNLHLSQAERGEASIRCLMVDVDHFKHFNDVHGHEAGDTVLREVGRLLKTFTDEGELAFRYGGEEFLTLLPNLPFEEASTRAEAIRKRVFALRIGHENDHLGPITVSIGGATAPHHCSVERLVQTADAALLRAKAPGRDRVENAPVRAPLSAA